ncbi:MULTISPECIES: hypothetical protein [unclassified Variovorax]|uniref:hypothetical protein n=1 Tax=unclassified Variovorax TaxID=663243 RepID=UPI00076D9373|nr:MULTISPECIES: hypothetical protein [unclassified Variovorax]KWT98297.1 hypothetical protein APY03_0432 [Variovorax sp. WDL1]PNG50048.1 hypothetical protein CHC06_05629 [Variovorax sp. B2]PNG50920.1 hypothetical protein CHC07_05534 [Variovorax sp. B4]VTU41588.1 hypothetical protein SRS16P1_00042 [Variovorax sp. SRS16]VTU41619.1 hypothetical protein E5P1_00042 [Variovorax sp. PBL-E5]
MNNLQESPAPKQPSEPSFDEEWRESDFLPTGEQPVSQALEPIAEEATAQAADALPVMKPRKRFFGSRMKSAVSEDPTAASPGEPTTVLRSAPIRILIGYLPEVRERDAREYALGVAEKHFDQPAMAFYDAFKLGDGYAYEVHEGGDGVAYLPQIIKYFDSLGPYRADEPAKVTIRTGTRLVEVERQATGLSAILLPESSTKEPTAWLAPRERMSPALNQRTRFLVLGAVFFVTGFFALVGSMVTRYQPYDAPVASAVSRVNYDDLPISRWPRLQSLQPNSYVAKVEYADKRWKALDIRDARMTQAAPVGAPPPPQVAPPAPDLTPPPAPPTTPAGQ